MLSILPGTAQTHIATLFCLLATGLAHAAELPQEKLEQNCASLEDKSERLTCYDRLFRPALPLPVDAKSAEPQTPSVVAAPPQEITPQVRAEEAPPSDRREEPCDTRFDSSRPVLRSPLAYRWDLDRCEKTKSIFLPHRPNYLLPVAFDRSLNTSSYSLQSDASERDDRGFKHAEAKFQLSFKVRLLKDLFWGNGDLWGAYTQRSFWQVYSRQVSSPFRESNYEPELIMSFRTPYEVGPIHGRYVNIAFNHQSNGRADVLSRSWNRFYIEAGVDGDNYMVYVRPWWRVTGDSGGDDNPGIENWMGRVEIVGAYQWRKHVFTATIRNNLMTTNNRGMTQLGWAYPLSDRIKSYVQYFNGYGESLIDYQHHTNGIGIGVLLGDWL